MLRLRSCALLLPAMLACASSPPHRIHPLAPDWRSDAFADLAALGRAVGNARVVVLGEASHGDGPTFLQKARVLRYLHQRLGFDVLAFESGAAMMEAVDSAIATGAPLDTVEALGMLSLWRGVQEVRRTLEYVAATRRTPSPIRVVGFDNQNTAIDRVAWIRRLGLDSAVEASLRARYARFSIRTRIADFDTLLTTLRAAKTLLDGPPAERVLHRRAIDDAIVQVGMFRMAASRAPAPFAAEVNNPRDRRMAENLLWLAGERFSERRIVVWIATPHALHHPERITDSTGKSIYGGMITTGKIMKEALGDRVYTLAFTSAEGRYGNVFDREPSSLPPLAKGSVESLLAETAGDVSFIDLRTLPARHPLRERRTSILGGYVPSVAIWPEQVDGVFFIRRTAPVTRTAQPR